MRATLVLAIAPRYLLAEAEAEVAAASPDDDEPPEYEIDED